jgi:hypothetical protein
MEIVGKIKEILTTKDISPSFRKRELILTTAEQYPQTILVEFTQDKTALLDPWAVGQDVKVSINIRGREWTPPQGGETKYFVSIQGWRIEAADAAAAPGNPYPASSAPRAAAPEAPAAAIPPAPALQSDMDSEDDLPF